MATKSTKGTKFGGTRIPAGVLGLAVDLFGNVVKPK